jgi:hypothetical protein
VAVLLLVVLQLHHGVEQGLAGAAPGQGEGGQEGGPTPSAAA